MADEELRFNIVLDLLQTLENLRDAERGSALLTDTIEKLRVEISNLQGDAAAGSGVLREFIGEDVAQNADAVRAAVEILKASLRELVETGRELGDLSIAFRKLNEETSQDPATRQIIDASIVSAVRELNAELKLTAAEEERIAQAAIPITQRFSEWRGAVDLAKESLQELVNQGSSLDDALKVLKDDIKLTVEPEQAKQAVDALTAGARELRGEFREAEKAAADFPNRVRSGFGDASAALEQLRGNVSRVVVEFRNLQASGASLEEARIAITEMNKETKEFSTKEISEGFKIVNEEAKQIEVTLKAAQERLRQFSENAKRGFGDPAIAARVFRENVDEIKRRMLQLQATSNQTLGDVAKGFRAANQASKEFTSGQISQAEKELKNLSRTAQDTTRSLSALDSISRIFFGTTLGNFAVVAVRRLVSELQQLAERGVEVSRTFFNLGVAVRSLQRVGLDITFAEVNEQVDRLSEKFSFFTDRQLREGLAQIFLLTRNLRLSKEEMFDLTEATAALAIVTGKDFAEEGLLVARAIASGYTEALQRAGIEASRFTIQTEAQALGIDKSFNAMTQAERAAVTLGLVLDQVGNVMEDVGEFSETAAGRIAELQASIEDQKDAISKDLIPVYGGLLIITEKFFVILGFLFNEFARTLIGATGLVVESVIAIRKVLAGEETFTSIDAFIAAIVDRAVAGVEAIEAQIEAADFGDLFGADVGQFAPDFAEATADAAERELDRLREKFTDIVSRFQDGIEDAWLNLNRRLSDLDTDTLRKLEDATFDFQNSIAEINRKFNDSIAVAQAKFREQEIQAEIKFQERLTQLREGFLFDIEDALRERDARQVLRLVRQFNLQQTQLQREEQIASNERERQFQLELAQLEAQRQIRLRELAIEFELKKQAIAEDAERAREDAILRFSRELEDNQTQFDRRLEQLTENLNAEQKKLVEHALAMIDISRVAVAEINRIWAQLLGGIGANYTIPELLKPGAYNQYDIPLQFYTGGGFAEGGTVVAKKPTLALFGEQGPEAATFTPINRVGANEGRVFGDRSLLGDGGAGGGHITFRMLLSEGLRAEIVDEALGDMAEIIVEEIRR